MIFYAFVCFVCVQALKSPLFFQELSLQGYAQVITGSLVSYVRGYEESLNG